MKAAIGKPNKVSLFLGEISYEIYLMHGLFISIFYTLGWIQNFYPSCVIVIAATVLAAILLHRLDQYLVGRLIRKTRR